MNETILEIIPKYAISAKVITIIQILINILQTNDINLFNHKENSSTPVQLSLSEAALFLFIGWRNVWLCLRRLHIRGVRHRRSEIWLASAPTIVCARRPIALGRVRNPFPSFLPPAPAAKPPSASCALVPVGPFLLVVRVIAAPPEDPFVLLGLALGAQLVAQPREHHEHVRDAQRRV